MVCHLLHGLEDCRAVEMITHVLIPLFVDIQCEDRRVVLLELSPSAS